MRLTKGALRAWVCVSGATPLPSRAVVAASSRTPSPLAAVGIDTDGGSSSLSSLSSLSSSSRGASFVGASSSSFGSVGIGIAGGMSHSQSQWQSQSPRAWTRRRMCSSSSSILAPTPPTSTRNRVALLQMPVTDDKSVNLRVAREYVERAGRLGASLCVLPEVWNSPYATGAFPYYAETLPDVGDCVEDLEGIDGVGEEDVVIVGGEEEEDDDDDNNEEDDEDEASVEEIEIDADRGRNRSRRSLRCSSSGSSTIPWGESSIFLMDVAKSTGMYVVGGSVPEVVRSGSSPSDGDDGVEGGGEHRRRTTRYYNTCLVIDPNGRVVGKHRKAHLFDVSVPGGIHFRESETLTRGDLGATYFDVIERGAEDAGDDDGGLGRIGVGICYDIRFPEYALLLTQVHRCRILIYPGAFNLTTGPAHWELLQRARAVDGQCFVLTASPARTPPPPPSLALSGEEGDDDDAGGRKYPHYSAWGHSSVVSPWGDVIATCDEGPAVVVADLDMNLVRETRMAIPTSTQKRTDLYRLIEGDGDGCRMTVGGKGNDENGQGWARSTVASLQT
ncbi:hypothetical protein ACHAW5_008397 [Stephanodiscus triporus]|uniref:CN hydrolase domain-containing protein n=1 Tax=Stephanodiscus triporus TaxID=2934178 RepID=A0ABD3QE65_9STRA